jgi:hypothetical protein
MFWWLWVNDYGWHIRLNGREVGRHRLDRGTRFPTTLLVLIGLG